MCLNRRVPPFRSLFLLVGNSLILVFSLEVASIQKSVIDLITGLYEADEVEGVIQSL